MTLDDLKKVFQDGYRTKCAAIIAAYGAYDEDECDSAGIAAVVRALRGKIGEAHCAGQHYQIGGHPVDVDTSVANSWSLKVINEILGSDAENEKAEYAGGMNDLSVSPAADPKVCVWTGPAGYAVMGCTGYLATGRYLHCPACEKPIQFQEQQS